MMPARLTATQFTRAGELLDGVLGCDTQIALDDACRRLINADRHERALNGQVNAALVSLMLRRRGFRRHGTTGTGYDRTPLYVKPAA